MATIKALSSIAEKWARVTPQRAQDFQAGIQGTQPTHWETNTGAAAGSWQAGVTAAAASGRFAQRVVGKGQKWQRKTLSVGVQRWGPGVQAAQPDFQAGFQPYHDAIAGVALPPRGPRGDPGNTNRVSIIASLLHRLRTGQPA